MSTQQEILTKLNAIEGSIWQSISLAVSEATNQAITFGNPLSSSTPVSALQTELNQPFLVIQFSFSNQPESSQVFLISQDQFLTLAHAFIGIPVATVDEQVINECRPAIEAMVQGLCLAVSNLRNDSFTASNLTTRFQIFSPPPSFQKVNEVFRTNIAITGEELSSTMVWLMDAESAAAITGVPYFEEEDTNAANPFAEMDPSTFNFGATTAPVESNPGLEILMDIPLEISVELGRMKMQVRDVVDLGAGSIVEIDKAAGEPVDVLVNGRLVAKGEVVVIEDNFGVRITEILSPNERLQRLNEAA